MMQRVRPQLIGMKNILVLPGALDQTCTLTPTQFSAAVGRSEE
jgi:hypothetical protein